MILRTIPAWPAAPIIVRSGGDVRVRGWERDEVRASTTQRWGLKLERKRPIEAARLRAKVGGRVLLDWRLPPDRAPAGPESAEAIDVQIGGSGEVWVPRGSLLKVYAGKSADVTGLSGSLIVITGRDALVRDVQAVTHISAGGALDFECATVGREPARFEAGGDLRCFIRDLADDRIVVSDLGGDWEGVIGAGSRQLRLKAGGSVTLVTDKVVEPQPPAFVLGQVERPA